MKKNRNTFFTKVLLILNSIALILIFLSYLATVINPSQFWYISYFGLAYPFVLAINILFILIWIFRKRWYFLLSIIGISVGFKPLLRTFNFSTSSQNKFETDSSSIKLMTYNTGAFVNKKITSRETVKTDILKLIDEEQPDILGIEEFYTRPKGIFNTTDSILKILKTKYFHYPAYTSKDFESYGIAVFSKFPIINKGTIVFSDNSGNRCQWVDIKKNNSIFRVYAVHFASIRFQPEDYKFIDGAQKDMDTKADIKSTKIIIKRLKIAFEKRGQQVILMKADMAQCKTPYIVMGDFNDTPCSYTLAQMTQGMKNGFEEKGSGLAVTYNGDFPNFQIDYVLASKQFNFQGYRIIKKDYSDHYPIRCNVKLSNPVQ
jgi:endonuclease/exonuclease/phosphatase family metal-dependent hydrolase